MIVIFLIFSEFLDFEKKSVKRELASFKEIINSFLFAVLIFLMKNLFLTDSLVFYSSIFSVILMIQTSVSSEILFFDFSESLFLILTFLNFFDTVSADLLALLVNQNMCLCCSKQL